MLRKKIHVRRSATLALVGLSLFLGTVWAQTEKVLHSFTGTPDGSLPYAGLVLDAKGNIHGTTSQGGKNGFGTVFKVTPSGKETVLYSFEGQPDGAYPWGTLILDAKGNMYGTTSQGGTYNDGTVFKLTPSGKETVLHSFSVGDGETPYAGLVADQKGIMYGTTYYGGAYQGGVVFKITSSGKETVMHSFSGYPTDGYNPHAAIILDGEGNVYGTTFSGGPFNNGTVFKVTPPYKETVLYSFGGTPDGANPQAALGFDEEGNLYGTTYNGGTGNLGAVFELTASGAESILYSFMGNGDGANPAAGLISGKQGNLYGTTVNGGGGGYGTVFELLAPSYEEENQLYSFSSSDGANPYAGLVFDQKGRLLGTTLKGGIPNLGTVFRLTLGGKAHQERVSSP